MTGWTRARLWLLGTAGLALIVIAGLALQGVAERWLAPRLAPRLQQDLTNRLAERFGSSVALTALTVRYDGGLLVEGTNLRIASVLHGVAGEDAKPMLCVKRFSFRTSLFSLLRPRPHLRDVQVHGVLLELPPVAAKGHADGRGREIYFDKATFDDAHVVFASADPKRAPLVFDFPRGTLSGIHPARPFHFAITVENGPPIGTMETAGTVGPWDFDDPRRTNVHGDFSFQNRDVSSVAGLRGRLTAHGSYAGTLSQMRAEGTTDDPAFGLDVSSRPVELHTQFAVTMDAAASVIHLERVEANFLHTRFTCSGNAIKSPAYLGYNVDLHLNVPKARIEDALTLATRTSPPIVHGDLALTGEMKMQAGPELVSRRLQLTSASFHLRDAAFTNRHAQQQVEDMSERAQGDPEDATTRRAADAPAQADGVLTLQGAVVRFGQMHVSVPGAHATMSGQYGLNSEQYQLNGTVQTEAHVSQMTTGLKSLLIKPLNGLFAHGHKGSTLPLSIHGSGSAVSFDVVLPGGKKIAAPAEHK